MKTIYLNAEFQCSTKKRVDTVQSVETYAFDSKCDTYIEGMRFVPSGQTWTRSDGVIFGGEGEMMTAYKDSQLLEEIQALHDEISTQQNSQDSQIAYIGMMTGVI